MQKNIKLNVSLILLSFVSLNYLSAFGWWISALATLLIIYLSSLCWPEQFKNKLGISITIRQFFYTLILFLILLPCSWAFILHIAAENKIQFSATQSVNFIHIFFYTLNEEMIMGGLFLFFLKNRYPKLHPLYISFMAAVFFATVHYVFYRWIFQEPARGILTISAMISLLMIGMIRNNLILKTGHIAYSWALHFSWMAIMFGFFFYIPGKPGVISETHRFNIFLGNDLTLVIILIITVVLIFWLLRNKSNQNILDTKA